MVCAAWPDAAGATRQRRKRRRDAFAARRTAAVHKGHSYSGIHIYDKYYKGRRRWRITCWRIRRPRAVADSGRLRSRQPETLGFGVYDDRNFLGRDQDPVHLQGRTRGKHEIYEIGVDGGVCGGEQPGCTLGLL